jgi:hypothetical protein
MLFVADSRTLLHDDVWLLVMSHLSVRDICALSCVRSRLLPFADDSSRKYRLKGA